MDLLANPRLVEPGIKFERGSEGFRVKTVPSESPAGATLNTRPRPPGIFWKFYINFDYVIAEHT